jgi:AraC-like DNA-binding protein
MDEGATGPALERLIESLPLLATPIECLLLSTLLSGIGSHYPQLDSLKSRGLADIVKIRARLSLAFRSISRPVILDTRVRRVLVFLAENHRDPHLNLEAAAAHTQLSSCHLSRLITRHTHKGFADHLRELRLESAKHFLLDPTLSIKEAAARSGFANTDALDRAFRGSTGLLPSDYRRSKSS